VFCLYGDLFDGEIGIVVVLEGNLLVFGEILAEGGS
jgi:hypothetical protein